MYVWVVHVTAELLDTHLGNGTGRRTATMLAPLLLTSGPARYEALLHGCGTNPIVCCCLHPSNIYGHTRMSTYLWQCALMVTL